ncbi:hypothetical protein, partial [Flavobacterium sp.]|uniref:hypothetical protein n=1 Tax=Flavobacterium sp. TaxID=239 RepID=UPI002C1A4B35|nr:hypothetical protein [Flavobacterium sp.]
MNKITQSISTKSRNSFKSFLTLCSLLLVSSLSFGQVSDDFTDGNFTASPAWSGNTAAFTIQTATPYVASGAATDGSYLASDTTTGNVTLSTPSTEVNEWKFSIGTGSFSPSSTNYFGVVLMSNVAVTGSITATSWNGYYLKIGTTSPDPIELWVKNGAGTGTKVGDFPTSPDYNSTALLTGLNIRVTRSASGVFELFYSTGFTYGATPTTSAGTLTNNTITTSSFFGVYSVFANPTAARRVFLDNVVLGNPPVAITSNAVTGNWSSTSSWVGGVVPTSADNAIIVSGAVITMDSATFATRNAGTTTTVNAGGTLATSQTYVNNGTTTINGSFQLNSGGWVSDAGGTNALVYGSNGTLIFNSTYTANNGNYWPTTNGPVNVTVNTGSNLTLGFSRTVTGTFQTAAGVSLSASTLTLNGTCQLNSGGFFNNSPTYGSASTLIYNTSYGVFNEWTGNGAAGVGIPANVRVQSGTLTLTTTNRGVPGNITIDTGCSLALNGTSGDLYLGGNWSNSGTFSPNGRAVFFNGSTTQTITNPTGETFNYLINDKSAGALTLANNVTVNATAGSPLQLLNAGTIDLNGQTLTLSNNGGNIQVTGGARTISSGVTGGTLSITGSKTVTSTTGGTLTLGSNVTTVLTNGINFGSSLTTIQGTLQVNSGGFVSTNSPVYSSTSTLVYNNVTGYGVNNEWTGNATTAGSGTPQNVTLTNSSVNLPGSARSLAGNLTIGTGSILNMNAAFGSDLNIGGNWSNSGTFNSNNRLVEFRGALAQTLTGATTFDFLTVNNANGLTLQTSSAVTVNQTLALTSGKLTLGANNLTVGASGTITGASSTNYVATNGTGQLRRTVAATNTAFPVGATSYNPITFNNSGTSDIYGVRVVDGAITTGVSNTKTISRRWITSEATAGGSNLSVVAQYNSGEENTGFAAAITPYLGFYNGTTWSQVGAVIGGSNPFTYTSSTNSTPADLTAGTQYFALGKDNAFLSLASQFVITSINPATPGAGYGFSVTVQSQDAFSSATNVLANTSFTLSTNGNAGTIGGTITGTILAGTNSVVVSGVTLSTAGTGATLTATQTSGDPLSAGTSASFNVLAAASQLAFVGVPATGNVGVNLASFTVEARRPDASVDSFYTGNITISKATGTGTLTGTLTVAAINGIATFSAAQFDTASTYTLNANSGSLTQATSGNIVVTLAPVSIFANPITGTNPNTSNPYTTGQTFNSNITVSGIGRGAGISGNNATNRYNTTGWVNTSASLVSDEYFEFILTPNLGYAINFNDFAFTNQRSASGPSTFDVRSNLDNFGSSLGVYSNVGDNTPITETLSLTSTSFDEVASSITFRIYGYNATGGTGSINDFVFTGNVGCIQPVAFTVTGGGSGCANTGVAVGLSGSQVGISYQLKDGATNIGSPVAGTGSAISFGNQLAAGTYTVEATNVACSLNLTMTGSATVTLTPIPTLDTITATPACAGGSSTVTLTGLLPNTAGSFLYTNSFTGATQYPVSGTSDSSGNFTFNTPALPLIANGAVITIISGTVTATGCTTTFSGKTVTVVVNPVLTASVSASASPSGAICAGTSVTFTATPTNGGSTPTYQWKVNGTDVSGETNVTFTTSTLSNNDVVTVEMTSNASPCLTGSPATSAGITMTVNPIVTASVSAAASPSGAICAGTSVTFTATPTNGGSTPTYQWKVNGTDVSGETNATFTTSTLANGDVVTVEMTSNATCVTGSPALSSGITMTVNPNPVASITGNNGPICSGSDATFNLSGTSGAIVTYNFNGNANQTVTLTGGSASVSVSNATANQTLNLVSVSLGSCTVTLTDSSTVNLGTVTTWDGTAWDNGAPTSTSAVVFTGNYTIGADLDACSITVTNNAVVSVTSGFNVTLYGAITVSSGSFTVNNNANLIQLTDVANSGNITVKRLSSAVMRQDYTIWSSPVAGQNLLAFSPNTLLTRFYNYNTTTNLYNAVPSPATTNFAAGQGYLIRTPNNFPTTPTVWPGSFTGVPNNGTINVALSNVGAGQRFNAVGNPYPSALDMNEFVADNAANITGTLYFWRKTNNAPGNAYCTWTAGTFVTNNQAQVFDPNDVIRTGQGFLVEATATGTSLEFNNSQRTADNANQFFKTTAANATTSIERNRMWLNLTNDSGDFHQMALGYITDATQGVDVFDGKFFNEGPLSLNSIINNEKYVIQGRALPFDDTDVVPLSLTVTTAGNYTISIDHLDGFFSGDQRIFIKDKTNNSLYDLKASSFTFATAAGTFNDRFEIVYRNPREANIQASQCGQTVTTLNQSIYANLVSGAQAYRFRVTNVATNEVQSIDKVLRVFNLTQLSNYAYDRVYTVEVAVKYNNVWQPFGNACQVIAPVAYTKVQSAQCGSQLANATDVIYADAVSY